MPGNVQSIRLGHPLEYQGQDQRHFVLKVVVLEDPQFHHHPVQVTCGAGHDPVFPDLPLQLPPQPSLSPCPPGVRMRSAFIFIGFRELFGV